MGYKLLHFFSNKMLLNSCTTKKLKNNVLFKFKTILYVLLCDP